MKKKVFSTRGTAKNIGQIRFVHGGVGRNVAENLAVLGIPTCMVSTVDESALGNEVVQRLRSRGVDTQYVPAYRQGMGMWLATIDDRGHLAGGISQQPDFTGLHELMELYGHEIVKASWKAADRSCPLLFDRPLIIFYILLNGIDP